jgi:hypothetical protein
MGSLVFLEGILMIEMNIVTMRKKQWSQPNGEIQFLAV